MPLLLVYHEIFIVGRKHVFVAVFLLWLINVMRYEGACCFVRPFFLVLPLLGKVLDPFCYVFGVASFYSVFDLFLGKLAVVQLVLC